MFAGLFGGQDGKGMGKNGIGADGEYESPTRTVNNSRYYEVLGISKDATMPEVKKAYHKLAKSHHPDKGGDIQRFHGIQQAFEVLGDGDKRRRYDEWGEEGMEDDGIPQHLFESRFGAGTRGRQQQRTKDVERNMWVTLEQLYTGVTRRLPITRKVVDDTNSTAKTCESCNGRGLVSQLVRMGPMVQQQQQACAQCRGTGSSNVHLKTCPEVLEVFVEKGSPDGHRICLHGKADEAPGWQTGDVIVMVKEQEHPRFLRRDADLYLEQDLSLAEALSGFKLEVLHLDGRKLIIRSNPGEVIRPQQGGVALKGVLGAGMPIHSDPFKFGNLFMVFSIKFPLSLEPPLATELRRLLGAPPLDITEDAHKLVGDGAGDEMVEHVYVQDLDPLESSSQKTGGEAYDEDEVGGMHMPGTVQCKQQ